MARCGKRALPGNVLGGRADYPVSAEVLTARCGKRALPAHCFATKDRKEIFPVIYVLFCGKTSFRLATRARWLRRIGNALCLCDHCRLCVRNLILGCVRHARSQSREALDPRPPKASWPRQHLRSAADFVTIWMPRNSHGFRLENVMDAD